MSKSAKIIVKGMVQGVGYRYFCYDTAVRLGVKGYAKNLSNGNVELEIECDESVFSIFISELKRGPIAARITDVHIEDSDYKGRYDSFSIK